MNMQACYEAKKQKCARIKNTVLKWDEMARAISQKICKVS